MILSLFLATVLSAPNVVLISVDTLRADHLGMYGHAPPTSPALDALASESLVFDDMICATPLTGPSMSSMMTSRYPRSTGVTRNGLRLPEDVPTVAEAFRTAGYETFCVTSNWTLKAKLSGLDRGFDVYDDAFKKRRWVLLKSERDAKEVTRRALELLRQRDTSKPFFAWFHYSDPHAPYKLRKNFVVSQESDYPGDSGAQQKVRYDSEIAYADDRIRDVLKALPRENTFVVFVADHGESLEEHGYVGHGRQVYHPGLHIPFFVHGPGVTPGRTSMPALGVDVGPTLLGLAGIDGPARMAGVNLMAAYAEPNRSRVFETYRGAVLKLPGAKEVMTNAGPEWQGALELGWKLIGKGEKLKEVELYFLPDDPGELHNVASEHPKKVADLEATVRAWTLAVERVESEEVDLSDEDVEALRSLGYVD